MKVVVIWDPLYEKVLKVVDKEDKAENFCRDSEENQKRHKKACYAYEYDEFEVE